MSLINDSFALLSSMSPKVNNTNKVTIRKVTKLALKKRLHRSSIYDKKPCIGNNTNLCIATSSSENISSEDKVINKKTDSLISDSIIVIESSSDAESANADVPDTDEYKTANSITLESEIDDNDIVLKNVTKCNSFKDDTESQNRLTSACNSNEFCTEINHILEKYDVCVNLNPIDNNKNFEQIKTTEENSKSKENQHVFLERKNNEYCTDLVEKYLQDDISEKRYGPISPFVQKWIQELETSFDKIDDIDNTNLKEVSRLLRFDEILGKSIANKDDGKEIDNENNRAFELVSSSFNNSSVEDDLVVKDSLEDSELETCPSTPKLRDDQEKLLNELYGNVWRDSQQKLLPASERKKPSHNLFPSSSKCKTDIRGKASKTYKNVFLDSERKKSSLLQTLHSARLRKNIESPWAKQLKNLCDSDTSSDKENERCNEIIRRLNFEDTDEDDNLKFDNINRKQSSLNVNDKNHKTIVREETERQIRTVQKKKTKPKPRYENSCSSSDSSLSEDSDYLDHKYFKTKIKQNRLEKGKCQRNTNACSFLESLSRSIPLTRCDPAARIYRENFRVHKDELAKKLFAIYNKNIFEQKLPENILLEWNDRLRGTAGYCYCRKITRRTGVVERSARIVLSTKVVDSADRLRDTLVHEMCHAATYIVNEVSNGHGPLWKAWAYKAMKVYPELPPIKRCHNFVVNTKYTYKCTGCGYSIGRHSKSLDIERKRCGHCLGKFEVLINKNTKDGVKAVPVTPQKKLTAFADFVKQNYKNTKTESLKHGDVMKILGQQFKEMKLDKK